ncbi:MAG: hypothetical protein ACM31D_08700 [Bacteroidota bacterium]
MPDRRLVLGALFFLASAAGTAGAGERLTSAELRQLAIATCVDKGEFDKNGALNCRNARAYPAAPTCPVTFTATVFRGRFTANEPQALVGYQSPCEPHANEFGGMALVRVETNGLVLQRWLPGAVARDCVVVQQGTRDTALCITSHMGQGQLNEAFAPLELDSSGSNKAWLSAGNVDGAYGDMVVSCSAEDPDYHHFIGVRGDKSGTVTVEAAYVPPAARRPACEHARPPSAAPNGEDADLDEIPLPQGYVALGSDSLRVARIRFVPPNWQPQVELTDRKPPAQD